MPQVIIGTDTALGAGIANPFNSVQHNATVVEILLQRSNRWWESLMESHSQLAAGRKSRCLWLALLFYCLETGSLQTRSLTAI